MALSSHQLEAFTWVAKLGNFSAAAKQLHVTQSALSQRIRALEAEIGRALFVRDRTGARLTEAGEELLRYTQMKDALELEALARLQGGSGQGLQGTVRIGSYSSVLRSILIPALGDLLRANPGLRCDFVTRGTGELPALLQRAEVDMIVLDRKWEKSGLETRTLGREEYVVLESAAHRGRSEYFLDNDENDHLTEEFFRHQGKKAKPFRRAFYGDCYGILDGVREGLGMAVMPRHLLKGYQGLRVVPGYKPRYFTVTLHYFRQPHYTKAHAAVAAALEAEGRRELAGCANLG